MKRFKDLSKLDQKKALIEAENEVMKMMIQGKVNIPEFKIITGNNTAIELRQFITPLIQEIAETAYYPDSEDVVIKL